MYKLNKKFLFSIFISLLSSLINKVPNIFLKIFTDSLYFISRKNAYIFIKTINFDKLASINFKFTKLYHILKNSESSRFKILIVDEARYENIKTPDIYEVTQNNYFNLLKHEISIYCFPSAKFSAKSDVIKIGNDVFWEKANRPEFAQIIPLDDDFVACNNIRREVICLEKKAVRYFDIGFNLCGVHTNTWAHFIISYLPKLIAFKDLPNIKKMAIFCPENMLENNKDLVIFVIKNFLGSRDVYLEFISDDEVVECLSLYYCNAIGYLGDHSTYVSPASACISSYGAKAIDRIAKELHKNVKPLSPKKLYIGRGAGRNLFNAKLVEEYFSTKGFEIIYPHLLTLEEKINIFGNATHICGPVSSGFANFIFCKNKVKILGFFNFARSFDTFISGLINGAGLTHELTFITGYEDVNYNINNSYYIELDRIKECCRSIEFFSQ